MLLTLSKTGSFSYFCPHPAIYSSCLSAIPLTIYSTPCSIISPSVLSFYTPFYYPTLRSIILNFVLLFLLSVLSFHTPFYHSTLRSIIPHSVLSFYTSFYYFCYPFYPSILYSIIL